ncbi:MAG TPA: hypothetical protein DCZ97_17765 [Syntrophus sp. (in: bacteria)]|nr:hypothetical protein [Syntrophus sp. (in: bacteria)]
MPLMTSSQAETEAVLTAAKLIMAAITTAPKGRGVSEVNSVLLLAEEIERLAKAMEEHDSHKATPVGIFKRDAQNIRNAEAVLLIGIKGTMPKKPETPLNCGACGYPSCSELIKAQKKRGEDFVGPLCAFQIMDLGIALGVAAKMAGVLNIDNRLMYSAGAAAMNLGFFTADLMIALPLSVSAKNIFFDRS